MTSNVEREQPVKDAANEVYNKTQAMHEELPHNVTAPTVYSIVGNLKLSSGYYLRDFLTDMADGLGRSLIDFDNYADDGSNPADAVTKANGHINNAARLATQIAKELEDAQSAINKIGYREPGDPRYRKPEDRK